MKKLSFFSIPRNKTRKETIEVIKNALIANGWKFVEKSERSKNRSWVRAEVVQKMSSICRHFLRTPQKQWVSDLTPRHRSLIGKGGNCSPLFVLGKLTNVSESSLFNILRNMESKKIILNCSFNHNINW